MKKIVLTLLCLLITSMALAIEKPCKKPCDIKNADSLTVVGNTAIGVSSDNVTPVFSILGDADSDASQNTADTLTLTLTPNATPTAAFWSLDSTQAAGFKFLKRLDIVTGETDNRTALAIDQTTVAASGSVGNAISITTDYKGGDQGNGGNLNCYSTGSVAVSDDLKCWKVSANYNRPVDYASPRMVDGTFGNGLWNVNSANVVTGAILNGGHFNVGIGVQSGDTTNPDVVTVANGVLIEKANFYQLSTALPVATFTNWNGILIKDTAYEIFAGDVDALDITNAAAIHIEKQTLGITNNMGIWLDGDATDTTATQKGASIILGADKDNFIQYNTTYGLSLQGGGGSTSDVTIGNAAGTSVFANPTGSNHVVVGADVAFASAGNTYLEGRVVHARQSNGAVNTATCADSGDGNPGALSITPYASYIELTNNDANGCVITLIKTSAVAGQYIEIWNVSANSASIADSAGVQEVAAGGTITIAQYERAVLRYASGGYWMVTQ